MSDEQWRYCNTCGDRVDAESIEGCRDFECPMKNPTVDTSDALHQALKDALTRVGLQREAGE